MKLAILLVLVCAVVCAVGFRRQHRMPHEVRFQSWMNKQNVKYTTQEEYETRLANFVASTKKVAELNARSKALNSTATFGLNLFAAHSHEEFSKLLGLSKTKTRPVVNTEDLLPQPQTKADATFDWRSSNKVSAVKDQEQCGSCWAFATTENIESVWMIGKNINANQFSPLAPQQIVDCDTVDQGCNGGDPVNAYAYVTGAGGLETEDDYPYTGADGSCSAEKSKEVVDISNFKYAIPSGGDESTMANVLQNTAPLTICVDASSWQYYQSGVLTADQCGSDVDHAVQAVGFDTSASTPYWIVRNSWADSWGISGYIYLEYNKNTCDITYEVTSAVL